MTPEIVPRWEWRTVGDELSVRDASDLLTPGAVQESDEIYALAPTGASVKLRDEVVDVKILEQVSEDGLERWRPILKATPPLSPDDAAILLDALAVTLPTPLERTSFRPGELVELLEGCDDLRAVAVHKTRRRYAGGGCLVELTTVRVGRAATNTVAVESEDPTNVVAVVEQLGFPMRPNVSMPRGLERLARIGAPRFGVIDLGTNSVKFHLAERTAEGCWRTIVDRAVVSRLGEGLDERGELQPEPMRRTVEAVADMVDQARRRRAESIVAVGTAGMRLAGNADQLVELVAERTEVTVEVISGDEESRLAYLAARAGVGPVEGTFVVFDTGGGSSQFTFGTGDRVDERFSLDIGAVRLTERFELGGPVTGDVLADALDQIAGELARLDGRPRPDVLVGLGGVVTNLAAVKHELREYDHEVVEGTVLQRSEIDRQIELYRTRTAEERRAVVGLQPGRAEVILAGACIVRTTMAKLGCPSLVVSDRGLRHGVLLERFREASEEPAPPDAER